MRFEQSNTKEPQPHPDVDINVITMNNFLKTLKINADGECELDLINAPNDTQYFNYKISDFVFDSVNDGKGGYELQPRITEYKNIIFSFGRKNCLKMTCCISYHQPNKTFKEELNGLIRVLKIRLLMD